MSALRSTIRLGVFLATSLVLVAAIVLSLQAPDIRGHLGYLPGLLANPLSVAIATAVLIFLVVERWRNIESEINKLRDEQNQTLREIRSDSEQLVKSKMDQVTNRAQTIEQKISDLIDKHPWVTDISEMEIIPDSPLCRAVLATAEELLATKPPLLCYEYLSSILRQNSDIALEGVGGDFLDLAWFCEIGLQDHYLAYRAIAKGIDCSAAYNELVPYYLRLAVSHADYGTASRMAHTISRQLNPHGIVRYLIVQQINRGGIIRHLPKFVIERSRRRDSEVAALASLAVFESAYGRKDRAERYLRKAQACLLSPDESIVLQLTAVESLLFLGAHQQAVTTAHSLNIDETLSSPVLMEMLTVLRKAGLQDSATRARAILHARLKKQLHDKGQIPGDGHEHDLHEANARSGADGHAGETPTRETSQIPQHISDGLIPARPDIGAQVNEHDRPDGPPVTLGDPQGL